MKLSKFVSACLAAFGVASCWAKPSSATKVIEMDLQDEVPHAEYHGSLRGLDVLPTEFRLTKMQVDWWNWNYCANSAYRSPTYTQPDDLVPKDYIFLAGYPKDCDSSTIVTRSATVAAGQTVFMPLINVIYWDVLDDHLSTVPGCGAPNRTAINEVINETKDLTLYNVLPSATKNGVALKRMYLDNNVPKYMKDCPNNATATKCDSCDAVPCVPFSKIDAFRTFGYWAVDTLTEPGTVNYAIRMESKPTHPLGRFCTDVNYVLTVT